MSLTAETHVRPQSAPEDDSGSEWLDQYRDLEEVCNDVSAHLTRTCLPVRDPPPMMRADVQCNTRLLQRDSGRDELVNNGEDGDKESLEARKRLVLLNKQVAVLGESLKKAEMDPSLAELYVCPVRPDFRVPYVQAR